MNMDLTEAQHRCQRQKRRVHRQVEQLQQQRQQQLAPSRLHLPAPWQPALLEQPTAMFMVVAAEACRFVALQDSRVQFTPQRWTYGPADCPGAWPPLWACLRTYTTAAQARSAARSQPGGGSTKGALALARVVVRGKAYTHAGSGCVAAPLLLFDSVLDMLPRAHKLA